MNNPDERTAVDQFGKGDKYFGVCTLMVTMPGPADVRARPDRGLHREVRHGVPPRLLGRDAGPVPGRAPRARDLPAAAAGATCSPASSNFLLYDFFGTGRRRQRGRLRLLQPPGRRARRWWSTTTASREARGWIRRRRPRSPRGPARATRRSLVQRTLAEGLGLVGRRRLVLDLPRSASAGWSTSRSNAELRDEGLYVELGAYRCQVFLDFRQVRETSRQPYAPAGRVSERPRRAERRRGAR